MGQRGHLLSAILNVSITAMWALSEWTLEEGSQYISDGGAVLALTLGLFFFGLYASPRVRELRDRIAETIVVQTAAFVVGLILLFFASMIVSDVLFAAESASIEYSLGSAFLLFICGVGGGSIVYSSGHTLFARVMD